MSSKGVLTPAQAQFFATILMNIQGKPNVDWNKIAEQSGYSCAKTAQTRYGQIMKQLAIEAGDIPKSAATCRQKQDKAEKKSKIGSGTNIGAMKITKSGIRMDSKPVKTEQVVQVWEESLDYDNEDDEA